MERLGEDLKRISGCIGLFQQIGALICARDEDNSAIGIKSAYLFRDFDTVNAAEKDVADQGVRRGLTSEFQRMLSAIDGRGIKIVLFQYDGQTIGNGALIIHNENGAGWILFRHFLGLPVRCDAV